MTAARPAKAVRAGASTVLRAARVGARPGGSARPPVHRAARFEDAFDRRLAALLRRRGWTVRIEPYAGYGGPGWVRVMARTLLAAPVVRDADLPGAGAAAQAGTRPAKSLRGWRSFATAQVAGAELEVTVGDRTHHVVTDRGGYVDALLEADLAPGWHDVVLRTQDGDRAVAPVHVVDPTARYGIVSDIDDTVLVTRLPRPLVAAWNVLVRHENAREPVPGMAELYHRLLAADPRAPVVYLSTGAWNAAPTLGRFLRRHGYPAGPMLLTDWGPTNTGWFRSGPEHKRAQLRRLVHELPDVRWILVGDDGQRDPEIYAEATRLFPEHLRAVVVRQLTFGEHVLARGLPVQGPAGARAERAAEREGVPVVLGPDGSSILRQMAARGLLEP